MAANGDGGAWAVTFPGRVVMKSKIRQRSALAFGIALPFGKLEVNSMRP
jgi:hypothetical protein